ncbi:hypothetical protein JMM61_20660 [Rhodovulum sulfidophilum]|uniref:hypothetical protein n=1 Tax=Rhodovulum sulfidophilum TaxID=35806 RepID=UPI00138A0B72|nr:hypothetical protein [Rhodovulum sulfidophilum]MBL3587727.1 hypothetical protein [Rhodovulum sulfidophilum]NDK37038.1 hypothetical protein [Rhodovulum sulfidophilum]
MTPEEERNLLERISHLEAVVERQQQAILKSLTIQALVGQAAFLHDKTKIDEAFSRIMTEVQDILALLRAERQGDE